MNKVDITNSITRTVHRITFAAKKHSPEILIVAGVGGVIASTVLACRSTLKVNDILEEAKQNVEAVHTCAEDEKMKDQYSEEDACKDLTLIYVKTAVKLGKLYAPAVALGSLSVCGIIYSNAILNKRNASLTAAYVAVDRGFKEYRSRVVSRFGEQVDHELRCNIKTKDIEKTVIDEKTGNEKKVKETVDIADPNTCTDYSRFFDESSCYWEKVPEYNLMFLRSQQKYANDKLRAQGYLFLNDVYEALDIPKSKAGQVVGWMYDPDDPGADNFVDFGMYEVNREKARDFVNGYERSILLNFNVDGPILDKCQCLR